MPYGKKLLIVEDNSDDVKNFFYRTTQFHFVHEIATNLSEAYESADRFKPDLMLLDVGLPFDRMTEATVSFDRILEFVHKYANLSCIIVLTGDLDPAHVKMGRAAGACGWIPKSKVIEAPEEFRQQIEDIYADYAPEGPLPPDEMLTPGQDKIYRKVISLQKNISLMRDLQDVGIARAAKIVKDAGDAVKDKALEQAKDQAYKRGLEAGRKKAREYYHAKLVGIGLTLWGLIVGLVKFGQKLVEWIPARRHS